MKRIKEGTVGDMGRNIVKDMVKHMKCDSDMDWDIVEGTVSMVMNVEGVEEETKVVVEAGAGEGAVGLGMDIQAPMDMEPIQNRYASQTRRVPTIDGTLR